MLNSTVYLYSAIHQGHFRLSVDFIVHKIE